MFTVVVAETANIYMHACKQIVAETHGAFLDSRVGILAEESLHRLDRRLLESLLRKVLLARIWRQNTNSKCVKESRILPGALSVGVSSWIWIWISGGIERRNENSPQRPSA